MISAFVNLLASLAPGDIIRPKLNPSENFWMPTSASTVAKELDWTYDVLLWISILSTAAIAAAMYHLVTKYRAKSRKANEPIIESSDHDTTLEITWSIIPLVLMIACFVWGFKGFVDMRTPPKDAYEVQVTGQKWKWIFTYPKSANPKLSMGYIDDRLHVPANRPVRLVMKSVDVIHSFWLPAMRVKQDVVPGRYTDLWFEATKTGVFPVMCTEYCGTSHSDMLTEIEVHDPAGFDEWLVTAAKKQLEGPPVEVGARFYSSLGCAVCHSTDGSIKTGPSFKGLFGKTEQTSKGSVTVDENYIRESILDPQSTIVNGFPPSMPTFKGQIPDKGLDGIIEFIKSQK